VVTSLIKEKELRVTQDVQLEKTLDRSLFELKCEISREKKNGLQSNEKDVATFAQLIIDIGESVKKESRIRLQKQQGITKIINDELIRFNDIISYQRHIRESSHHNFLQKVERMKLLIREKLADLRYESEVWLHNFKNLLDEISNKI
jgi:hypothetical protein